MNAGLANLMLEQFGGPQGELAAACRYFNQAILSFQLPFAVAPLIRFTSDPKKMGPFVSARWVRILAYVTLIALIVLNASMVLTLIM